MISRTEIRSLRGSLLRWFEKDGRNLPWRRTRDPYSILVSEFMLQQTQVGTVQPFYERWLRRFPNFEALAAASENEVLHAWQGLGYYTRARNLHAAARIVRDQYDGVLPRNPATLRKLPGMGRYISNAVVTFAFDQPLPIVEANSGRVITRLFDIRVAIDSAAGRELVWKSAEELVPRNDPAKFNSALMDLGALICVSRQPKCNACPVTAFCRARQPQTLPIKKSRPRTVRLTESHMFVRHGQKILLEHCSGRWRGMWMLPSFSRRLRNGEEPVHSSVFPFTHHRITLRVFRRRGPRLESIGTRWVPVNQLNAIPIPSPHRRAINALLVNIH